MDALVSRRTVSRARFTKYYNTCKSMMDKSTPVDGEKVDPVKLGMAKNALKTVTAVFDEIQTVQAEIDSHPENEARLAAMAVDRQTKELTDEESYNTQYYEICAKIEALEITPDVKPDNGATGGTGTGITPNQLTQILSTLTQRKRQINIPKFNGQSHLFDQWKSLLDAEFEKPGYSDVEKAHYTLSLLEGEAQRYISTLKDPSYEEIIDALDDKYGDVQTKIEQAVLEIANLKPVTSTSVKELDRLYSKLVSSWNYILKKTQDDEELVHSSWVLTCLVRSKLPKPMLRRWDGERLKEDSKRKEKSTLPILFDVLIEKVHESLLVARRTESESTGSHGGSGLVEKKDGFRRFNGGRRPTSQALAVQNGHSAKTKCNICDMGNHEHEKCSKFLKMKLGERWYTLKDRRLKCLMSRHLSSSCEKNNCSKCNAPHHDLLHGKWESRSRQADQQRTHGEVNDKPQKTAWFVKLLDGPKEVLLQSGIARVESQNSVSNARVLFDSGAAVSFIRKRLPKRLGLKGPSVMADFLLAGGSKMTIGCEKVKFCISAAIPNWDVETFEIEAYSIDKPSADLPPCKIDVSTIECLNGLQLADEYPRDETAAIDVLLGVHDTMKILMNEQLSIENRCMVAQKRHFGWVLAGAYPTSDVQNVCTVSNNVNLYPDEGTVSKFWELESLGILPEEKGKPTPSEQSAIDQYNETTKLVDGQYKTGLIRKPEYQNVVLKSNRLWAEKRLPGTENKLKKNPQLQELYIEQIQDLKTRGHAVKVDEKLEPSDRTVWYLPHHAIVRLDKTTTKLRVVMDGSAVGPEGVSLNDTLLPGPKLQVDICGVLLRFRCHPIALVADIEKMFRQIKIKEEDQDSQRFLWRDMETGREPDVYKLTTVVFGLTPSPFSSIMTIRKHAESMKSEYPVACEEILSNTFVDDVLSGEDSVAETAQLAVDLKNCLAVGGFPLRKFISSEPDALKKLEPEDLASHHTKLVSDSETKALGVRYLPDEDSLMFSFYEKMSQLETETRRTLLQQLNRIYDPMGMLSLFIIKAMFQAAWTAVCGWDDPLPDDLCTAWLNWKSEVKQLDEIKINRCLIPKTIKQPKFSIHGFGDASESAYASCVYLRVEDTETGEISVSLLCSKTRVAPLKERRTIPELELMAAFITARLVTFVTRNSSQGTVWKLACKCNPADICSRGCLAGELVNSKLWWHGPEYLMLKPDQWPKSSSDDSSAKEIAVKKARFKVKVASSAVEIIDGKKNFLDKCIAKYKSYHKFVRVMSLVRRPFIRNEGRDVNTNHPVKTEKLWWWRYVQEKHFPEEIKCLKSGKEIPKSSMIRSLNPMWDDESQLIKVGGRLSNALLPDESKHPIILPSGETLVRSMILWHHKLHGHTGVAQTLANVRYKHWIVRGRREVRQVINDCRCKEPKPMGQKMGQLPAERLIDVPPFTNVGVDFAGPLYVVNGNEEQKSYILLFTCMSTRAVHLELTEDLSAPEFLKATERMMHRRGKFTIEAGLNKHGVTWKFIPPKSPWQGGFYERLVRSVKEPLRKILGKARLTFNDLRTVLVEVECQLNSRPLTIISADQEDPLPLTPGHFLVGRNLQIVPDIDDVTKKTSFGQKWQYRQRLAKLFWSRWYKEYLVELNKMQKWTEIQENAKIGDVVLVADDNVKKADWRLGRIIDVHMGRDDLVRSVTVKTVKGVIRRPVQRLRLVESADDDEK
ncbi:uncharacterized protein LOC141904997 [Tubulanus polymorphus]|uniref:uncharacterized protein LOC141904997 n=1 Tax=Tubulanus polymorphus TaxID=672921 RepID=UPI003DA5FB34